MGLPLGLFNTNNAHAIAKKIRSVQEIDFASKEGSQVDYFRVEVSIEVNKLLFQRIFSVKPHNPQHWIHNMNSCLIFVTYVVS